MIARNRWHRWRGYARELRSRLRGREDQRDAPGALLLPFRGWARVGRGKRKARRHARAAAARGDQCPASARELCLSSTARRLIN